MNEEISKGDSLNEFDKPALEGGLNVLTILTFIGCGIGYISSLYSFFTAKKSYDQMKDLIESGKLDNAPKWAKSLMGSDALANAQKLYENRLPILILGIVATSLCLWGALEMRKLKKQGYTFWLIGEILPLGTMALFIGMSSFGGFGLLAVFIPAVFIILYTVNKKYLVN